MMGVYTITNIANAKVYVGSTKDFAARQQMHLYLLRKGRHHSRHLQRSWNKHSEDCFVFKMLEEVFDEGQLIGEEQAWIDALQPFGDYGYNISPTAGSTKGAKRTPEQIEETASFFRGRKLSVEHKAKISPLGRKHTAKTRQKQRVSAYRRNLGGSKSMLVLPGWRKGIPVIQIYPDCSIVTWQSSDEAAAAVGLKGPDTIRRACNDASRRAAGCSWRFAEPS